MSKKMVFQNTDKLFYVAVYTDVGDFSKLSEKGYETAKEAGASVGFPEGTPTGELVQDEEVVEATVVAEVAVETPETTEEKVETLEDKVEDLADKVEDLEAKTDGQTPAEVTPEPTLTIDNGEATVAPSVEAPIQTLADATEEAPIDTVKEEATPEAEVVAPAEEVIA